MNVVPQKNEQWTVVGMLVFLTALEVARDPNIRYFFQSAWYNANSAISGSASGKPAQPANASTTLDFHKFIYWGVGAIILVALADPFPTLVIMFLVLIIAEVLLVHWKDYAKIIAPPTK